MWRMWSMDEDVLYVEDGGGWWRLVEAGGGWWRLVEDGG